MKIQLLPENRWSELAEIFDREFDSALPEAGQANIIAALGEAGNVKGFLVAELLVRVGQIYVSKGEKMLAKKLIDYAEARIPKGASVIVIASEERFESLIKRYGMREVEGKVFRRDL